MQGEMRRAVRFPISLRELPGLVLSGRARRAVHGLGMLRRAHEHVVVMAAVEGARLEPTACYEGYVDALEILSERAAWIANGL